MAHDRPTYESHRHIQATRTRDMLRLSSTLDKPRLAREIILEWLEHKSKGDLPEIAWKGEAFTSEVGGHKMTALQAETDRGPVWALRAVLRENQDDQTAVIMELAIRETPGEEAHFSIRCQRKSAEARLRTPQSAPPFLAQVADECILEQGAAKIEKDPWIIESDYDAANLTEFLVDPDRRTPAFVLTVPEESSDPNMPLLDPTPLATDTLGVAKVVVLPAEYTWKLTNRFGKRLSVYRGAMRIYLRGFREDTDPEGGHDLFMPHRMDTPETAERLGNLLRWVACRESIRSNRLGREVVPFASMLVPGFQFAARKSPGWGTKESEQVETAKAHLETLHTEILEALECQQTLIEANQLLEAKLREAGSKARGPRPRRPPQDMRGQGYQRRQPSHGGDRDRRLGGFDRDRRPGDYRRESRPGGYGRDARPGGYRRDRRGGGYGRDRDRWSEGGPRRDRDYFDRGDSGGNYGGRDWDSNDS